MKKNLTSRRELLKTTAFGGVALAAGAMLTSCSKKEEKAAAPVNTNGTDEPVEKEELPYVDASSNKAKALRYAENGADVPAETRVDKGDTKGADQFCTNCQFYSEGGKCALFPGKLVKEKGWCVSWSLKAQS